MRKSGSRPEKTTIVNIGEYDSFTYTGGVSFKILAGVGDNWIKTDLGNDLHFGNDGDDYLDAGNGNNYLDGGADQDSLFSGNGNDTILGGSGNDFGYSGGGNDLLDGGTGDDTLIALTEVGKVVTMLGKSGHDYMLAFGYGGKAKLDGGTGNDIIVVGDSMTALLTGGDGADTFMFNAYNGGKLNATISDLEIGDTIDFASLGTWTWDETGHGHFDALSASDVTVVGDVWTLGNFGTVGGIDVVGVSAFFGFDYDIYGGGKG